MDIDDEDAFLYGDSEPVDTSPAAGPGGVVNDVVKTEEAKQNVQFNSNSSNLIPGEHSNGAPQSAKTEDDDDYNPYGDELYPEKEKPSTTALQAGSANGGEAGAKEEGGEMEEDDEEDDEDEDDDDDDDDDGLDIVVAAPQRSMDFRNATSASTTSGPSPNIVVAGFGLNAAALAGKTAPVGPPKNTRFSVSPSTSSTVPPGALPNAVNPTDGTPQANALLGEPEPLQAEPPHNVSSIANDPSHSLETRAAAAATEPASHLTGETARILPPSDLPAPHAPGSQPVPPNPYAFTLEPPTTRDADSVYDYDMRVMNASGQPWRARGSDMSRWFNYGFDEYTWKRYCDYRKEMVKGIEAMKQIPMDQPLTVEAASLLHLPVPAMHQNAMAQMGIGLSSGLTSDPGTSNNANQDMQQVKEEGEQTPDQQLQSDAMNTMMQMGFPMNPEQMQQQMMMMQQQMMGGGNQNTNANAATENNSNNGQTGVSDNAEDSNQANGQDASQAGNNAAADMSAMMAMGGMPDMQTMMSMFGMGMPGMNNMGNMNGMPDMNSFQNMASMAQAMGNFGNNSPASMMGNMGQMGGMGDSTPNSQMENKRGPVGMQQQNIPTGPGHHNLRGGFRGRGRGGLAIRGRGGNALPLGPRSTIPNAPKGPKATRSQRDAVPEGPKAGLDYGESEPTPAATATESTTDSAPARAPLPSRQELTREHTPSESSDDDRRKQTSPKRGSGQNTPVGDQNSRDVAPSEVYSGRDSDAGQSDSRTDDRTKSSTGLRRSTRDGRDSSSRPSQHRDSKTSSEKTRSDRHRSSKDDRGGKDDKSRASRRSSRSRERRRDEDRDKDRKGSTRHHRSRSDRDGGSMDDEEEVKKETRRSTRLDADKS